MAKKRKAWFKRLLGVTLAAALVVQPMSAQLGSVSVVHAAEDQTEEMKELVTNGDFSDVSADGGSATGWELRVEGATTAKFENGKAVFDIQEMGADWSNYLKYTPGIDLKNGWEYVISFTAKSSVDRTIQYGFDGGRIGIFTKELTAGEETPVSYTYTASQDYLANPYMFYLGKIDNVDNPTEAHIVEISNFSVRTTGNVGGGNEGGETPGVVKPAAPIGLVAEYWATDDADKGKIRVAWGAALGDGGTPDSWTISIDGKELQTVNAVGGYFFNNTYAAGKHTVTLKATNTAGSSTATATFTLTEEQADGTDGPGDDYVPPVEGNLLTNGNFADKGEGWSNFSDVATITWNEGSVVFDINGNVADYAQSIYQELELEAGAEYRVSFDIESTVERTVAAGFDNTPNRDEFHSETIAANTKTTLTYDTTNAIAGINKFMIYLGGAFGTHTVTISNVSIVKIADAGGDIGGGNENTSDGDTEDGEYVAPVEGNLLKNGNFENKGEGWSDFRDAANVTYNKYQTVFEINGEAADWGQGLYQLVQLEAGLNYRVTFYVETSVARTVTVDMNDRNPRQFTSDVIPAGEKTKVTFDTTSVNDGTNKFFIYLGGVTGLGKHKVVISDVSIVEIPLELPNDENDEPYTAITSIGNLSIDDAIALKDGNFTNGLGKWDHWEVDWMREWSVVTYTPAENGMKVHIKNVGDGEGNVAWDAQLNQNIDLKAGLEYTISFDVTTEKARAINVTLTNSDGTEAGFVKTIGLQKNESRHVVYRIPVLSEEDLDKYKKFSIQMGKVTGEVSDNTLTFSNMKIEVNGYEDLSVLINDGDFTEGLGSFTAKTTDTATVNVDEKNVLAEIMSDTSAEDVTLTKSGLALEAGVTYTLSFVAGAVSGKRMITVQLPDGTSKDITLTDDAKAYTVEVTPASNVAAGDLVFKLGGAADTICLDSIRLDVKGFAEAKGLNISKHDITRLTKNASPVISEQINAIVGNDVVLTFEDAGGAYKAALDEAVAKGISPILIDGVPVAADKYKIEAGTITLDKSLFTIDADSERKTFYIQVNAYWYEPVTAIQIVYATKQWESTWADEFNDTKLDMTKWSYQNGTGAEYGLNGWGNNEQQYYTDKNLELRDGALVITATKEEQGGKPYSSARIWTMNDDQKTAKFSQTYGRFEAKMKLPAGEGCQGLWPAFWLLPVDSPYGGWPVSGEIDIMEARGRQSDRIDSTLHFGRNYPNEATAGSHYGDDEWEELDITEYHIYSVDWTPHYMSFQVDGIEFYRVENWYCQNESEPQQYAYPAPFDQEFYIILNLAVGGMYDEYRNPSDSALPAEMKVDYVRVYQSTDPDVSSDSYIAPDPELEKDMNVSDTAKVELIDPEFKNVLKVTSDEDNVPTDGWKLLTLPQFGGAADLDTVQIDGETFAKIKIGNAGSAEHSIQMTQSLSLHKGHWYTLSFDAKADEARSLISKIGTDGSITGKWTTFNAITTKLTKDVKHYEYTFQMLNDSDEISRLELNLGANGTAAVYLANVEFKEVDGFVINPDVPKDPLENGNHIYNGAFSLGNTSRMAYWQVSDGVSGVVRDGNEYFFRSRNTTDLYQTGLELLQSDTYKLTFDAKADAAQEITVVFSDRDKKEVYASQKVSVGTTAESKEVTITMPAGVTDTDGVVTFKLGAGVELDNIVLKRTTYNNVDYTGLNCYPLPNGDFEMDDYGWSTWQTNLTIVTEENGNKIGRVGGTTSTNRYEAVVSYGGLKLAGGYDYELTFDAKASTDAVIDVVLETEDGTYTRHFQQTDLSVGTDWKTYTYDFKLSGDITLALKFLTGGAKTAYNLDLDNIVLKMKGAPEASGIFMPNGYNKLGEDVVILHNGTSKWYENAVVKLDGKVLAKDKYTFAEGQITLDKSLFTESKEYTISATAEGYADSTEIKFKLYPANGDRICNGDFNGGDSAWNQYIHGGNSATLDYSKGYVDARYLHAEGDEYGNPSVPWSIQVNQTVNVDKAGSYDISFVACSEVERYIMVSVNNQTTKVKLTQDAQIYTVTVDIANAGTYEVQFQMGTVDPNVGNGYFPIEGFVDFAPHNFYLDSVSMLPAGTTVDKTDSEVFDIELHLTHSGGEATCISPAICEECGQTYGDVNKDNHTGGTEVRGKVEATATKDGYTGDTYCKGCGAKLVTGTTIPATGEDEPVHTHTGGKATCTTKAKCTVCGESYGSVDKNNHAGGTEIRNAKEATYTAEGYTGDTYCKGCGAKIATGKTIPKKAHTHTGGKATCTTKAKCTVCGESYGSVDKNNHTGGTEVRGKVAATATKAGYTGDTYCKGCGAKLATGKTIPATGSTGNTGNTGNTGTTTPKNGWYEKNGAKYWYENGVKQGTEGRGKEIYDKASDAWYWLDAPNGVMAKSKDVYQESLAGDWGDYFNENGERCGKWVRYDENGHMVKGWQDTENGKYYFDLTYGTMAKGYATIDGTEYYFNPATGVLEQTIGEVPENGWKTIDGKDYWYENYVRQGYSVDASYRGKEIYDSATDAWYWLDNVQGGAKAVSKDVYQESLAGAWGDYTNADGELCGKWVRYDENGHMIKGWQTTDAGTYFFDYTYGTMAKGSANIDGVEYYFDSATGIRQ